MAHRALDDVAPFSPDGERLAFVSTRDGYADILVMAFSPGTTTAESRAVYLTRRPGSDFNPAFSPDGSRIAFSRQEHLWSWPDPQTENGIFEPSRFMVLFGGLGPEALSLPGARRHARNAIIGSTRTARSAGKSAATRPVNPSVPTIVT